MIEWEDQEDNPNEKWRKIQLIYKHLPQEFEKRKKCQRCVKWDSMRRKKKTSLPILFTFPLQNSPLSHTHSPFDSRLGNNFSKTVRRHCGNRVVGLPYQLDRLVSFPVSNYPTTNPFLPSRETKRKKNPTRAQSQCRWWLILVSWQQYWRTVVCICCFLNFRFESTAKMTGESSDCFW